MLLNVATEVRFLVNLKGQTSTIILSLGMKYSMRDLLCDISYYM